MKNPSLLLVFSFLIFLVISCTQSQNQSGNPKELRFGISTRDEDPGEASVRMEGMKKYLEKELGIEVKIFLTSGYSTTIEALKSNKLDISSMGSYSYILASEYANVEAISCRGTVNGHPEPYHSLIITWPGSGIRSIQDVNDKASQLTVAYGDPASTSGHLYPRDYLESIGLPNKKFKQVFFTNSHTATFFTVRSKKTDIGCVSESLINKLTRDGQITKNDYVVLWKSESIIDGAICIRKSLDQKFKRRVQKAFADFRFKDNANWKLYASRIAKETILDFDSLCYINANDSMYNKLRIIAMRYKMLNNPVK